MFDSVSAHIPLKIKEKVWAGEYIDMSLVLKSGKDLVYDSQLNGELAPIVDRSLHWNHYSGGDYPFVKFYGLMVHPLPAGRYSLGRHHAAARMACLTWFFWPF
jgi:hypothetical protein